MPVIPPIPLPDGTPIPPGPTPSPETVVSQPAPLLPLDIFRQILGYNPYHFWGLANAKVQVTSAINTVVREYAWQSANASGREDIRRALLQSESMLRDYLLYAVAPRYVESELLEYTQFYDKSLWAQFPLDATGHWKAVNVKDGYIQAVGVEALTLLGNTAVTYSDTNGDDLVDTFVATILTTQTDPAQLAVYFTAADRLNGESAGERWRIQPVTVTIASGVATVRGAAWLLVKPILYEGVQAQPLDPDDTENFVATVDVSLRQTDPNGMTVDTSQGKFIWETLPAPDWAGVCWGDGGNNSQDPAAQAYALARVGIRDPIMGTLTPGQAVYNADASAWVAPTIGCPFWRPPDRVLLRYKAGYPLQGAAGAAQMDRKFQAADARLAMGQLAERIAAGGEANRELSRWQMDRSRIGSQIEQYTISREDLSNPFGTRAGEIFAWKVVQKNKNTPGVTGN